MEAAARIVLIDDHAQLRSVMAEMLAGAGYETIEAGGGVEGLALLRRERPDLVLCDINMPDLDGFGVLRAVRADPDLASLAFVFLTSEGEVRAGMRSGADDYLMKPVSEADLLAAVGARLARRETTRRESDLRVAEIRRTVAALLPHEIRTPLTTIIGSARLMQEFHGDFGPQEIEQMAGGILKAALRLSRMAENYILQAELGMHRLLGVDGGPSPCAGTSGATDVETAARAAASQAGRSGDLELDVRDVTVPIAPAYFRKIVSELADNAFKFSAAGMPVQMSLSATPAGPRLEVADNGRGMTLEQIGQIEAFRQFDRGRFEQQGSGVGLALVRSIAEVSGGRFELTCRPEAGLTVAVAWPGLLPPVSPC
jgi:two-component system sensor histidine kinase/response regulator